MSHYMQALPWEARQDEQGWVVGQPAIFNGERLFFEVARIVSNPKHAEVVARLLSAAVNEYREPWASGVLQGQAEEAMVKP